MRVIAGTCRGLRLKTPKGNAIRPTLDRVREAVFDMLRDRVAGATVMDLYAGTGALAIEALSRGAKMAYLVDSSPRAVRLIEENLELAGFSGQAQVIHGDAMEAVQRWIGEGLRVDLVLADPPYEIGVSRPLWDAPLAGILQPGGLIAIEWPARARIPTPVAGLVVADHRRWGDTAYVFLAAAPAAGEVKG